MDKTRVKIAPCKHVQAVNKLHINEAGKTEAGSHRYRCYYCGKKYTPEPKRKGYPEAMRQRALQMCVDGISLQLIGRHLGIHHRTISLWAQAHAASLPAAPKARICYSDAFEAYNRLRYHPGRYEGSQGKTNTYSAEAVNAELRHYLARSSRCFSRCPQALECALHLFVYCFNSHQLYKQRYRPILRTRRIPWPTNLAALRQARQRQRQARHAEIHRLRKTEISIRIIARQLDKSPTTIYKYLTTPGFPQKIARKCIFSILNPYGNYLDQRRQESCRNARQLWSEIRQRGYSGTCRLPGAWSGCFCICLRNLISNKPNYANSYSTTHC